MVHINKIHIRNYKSLEDTLLEDCRTYNLLLGRPNVGKSNILEALSLFSLPYLLLEKREIGDLLRYQHNISELFFDGDVSRTIMVQAGDDEVALERVEGTKFNWTADFEGSHEQLTVTGGRLVARKNNPVSYPVFKRYDLSKLNDFPVWNFLFCCR
jgi:recombinational DNA repair ATPase RecF